ncbi:MAG: response regulator, partial [Candidatus Heimdallarchaeota archaeon]
LKAVSSGNEGLAFIKSARNSAEAIDVVIIDMALEDIAGLELCKKIKQFDSSIHTVIISSWGVNFYTSTLNEAGVDAVLHKPFRLEQLSQILPGPKKRDEQKYK